MRQIWVGSILLSTALSSPAATLGRYSGAVVIGRPLDVRIQAIMGPDEDLATLCIQSDVFFGDNQLSAGSVRVTSQRSGNLADASVRVVTTQAVDEPIVSLVVRMGCTSPFSRRYVLLADLISEPASAGSLGTGPVAPASVISSTSLPPLGPTQRATRGAGEGAGAATGASRPDRRNTANRDALAAVDGSAAKPRSVVKRPAAPVVDTAPRLQLEPVDLSLSIERDPALKLSLSLLSEPTTSDEERAAAGLLWKAINAAPEDILRDSQKLAVLEAESKGLREQEARNKAAMLDMEARLQQARYMSWLAYGLGALLLLSLAALVWMRRRAGRPDQSVARARGEKAWWAAQNPEKTSKSVGATDMGALDLDLSSDRESSFDGLRSLHEGDLDVDSNVAALHGERRDFASAPAVSRSVATEELFDIQQQADFFVSLGENEQAIEVLKNHLMDSQEPSALAYLDLFKLYHKLGRRSEYDHLREEFNRVFNAGAPPFDQYTDESHGLEAYETAFGRIQALWPQPRVLDVIEQSIFREANDTETEVFDLEAYRELLLLHAIAKEMIKRDAVDNQSMGSDFEHTAIRPLKGNRALVAAAADAMSGRETVPGLDVMPPPSPRLGLDVDLDMLSEISAFEASLPDVDVPVEASAKPAAPPGAPRDQFDEGNLIDFEVLDFMPPDEPDDKFDKPV